LQGSTRRLFKRRAGAKRDYLHLAVRTVDDHLRPALAHYPRLTFLYLATITKHPHELPTRTH
jgi:hypothetical protein